MYVCTLYKVDHRGAADLKMTRSALVTLSDSSIKRRSRRAATRMCTSVRR